MQDFNLTIEDEPSTITTIAGESGSGKTTLANLVLGFTKITSGQIIYKGADVSAMNRNQLLEPRLIVADEPVSMVDASLRAMILDIMLRLRDQHNISFLYITHDLSTAYQIGDRIYLLYQGAVAERGQTVDVIEKPKHPYVQLLIDSIPVPDPSVKWGGEELTTLDDEQMRVSVKSGCRFYGRCKYRMDRCLEAAPPLVAVDGPGHESACYLYEGETEPARERVPA